MRSFHERVLDQRLGGRLREMSIVGQKMREKEECTFLSPQTEHPEQYCEVDEGETSRDYEMICPSPVLEAREVSRCEWGCESSQT